VFIVEEHLKHFFENSKDDNITHYKQDNLYYDSSYDENNNIVFRITDENHNFKGYCNSFEMKCYHPNGSDIKEPYFKTYYPMKPYIDDKSIDNDVIAFIASKNKGDREEATEMIVDKLKRRFKFYTTRSDNNPEIWIYKEGIYVPEGRTHIQEYCRIVLGKLYTTNICNQVVSKIEADTYIEQDKFFNNSYVDLIAVENGILNIKTKELINYDSSYIFFNKLNIIYNKDIVNDVFENFFNEILHYADIKVMQELFGYCLLKDYPIHKSFMFNGCGRNGKGTTNNILEKFININNIAELTLKDMEEDNFTLCRLHNKMVNISGDIDNSYIEQSGTFKKLCGGDTITAKRKFKTDINFKNYAKMIFACNELPKFKDESDGQWSRWILIDFPYKFKSKQEYDKYDQITIIKEGIKLMDVNKVKNLTTPDNMSALLNWSLDGLNRLLKQGYFTEGNSKNLRESWKEKNNTVIKFVRHKCIREYGQSISVSEFCYQYGKYCQENKIKTESSKVISNTLEKEFGIFKKRNESYINFDGINIKNPNHL